VDNAFEKIPDELLLKVTIRSPRGPFSQSDLRHACTSCLELGVVPERYTCALQAKLAPAGIIGDSHLICWCYTPYH
jgi:hypothetical protein